MRGVQVQRLRDVGGIIRDAISQGDHAHHSECQGLRRCGLAAHVGADATRCGLPGSVHVHSHATVAQSQRAAAAHHVERQNLAWTATGGLVLGGQADVCRAGAVVPRADEQRSGPPREVETLRQPRGLPSARHGHRGAEADGWRVVSEGGRDRILPEHQPRDEDLRGAPAPGGVRSPCLAGVGQKPRQLRGPRQGVQRHLLHLGHRGR
mmetsp:Transcript_7048/g.19497  ORF Transcript_7048/g.19497 Transcript_7048/m.19497 type:complete len:208 (+) Transcript_7048:87-710(+)